MTEGPRIPDYERGLLDGASRVLDPLLRDHGNWSHVPIESVRRQKRGVEMMREIFAELMEVRAFSRPCWPRMLAP